jgi:hypothetical protein
MGEMVGRLRAAIDIQVVGRKNAFTVSFVGGDPRTVMQVTNTLARYSLKRT